MKKSLIALAVLASTGAAMAQSSVTLYGIVDVNLQSTKVAGIRTNQLESGGVSGSRFGIKGTEDLGGGLKALFVLENGFNADDGTSRTNGSIFDRQSYVGLAGGFGEVRFGNSNTAFDDIAIATNPLWDSILSPTAVTWNHNYVSRPGNTIYYATPAFGGLTAAASYSLGENKNTVANPGSAKGVASVNVQYAAGPLYASLGYQEDKRATLANIGLGGPTAGVQADTAHKNTLLNASYDFGVAKLLGSFERQIQADETKTNQYQIGVDVPVGAALTLSTGFAWSKDKLNGVDGDKRTGYALGASYSLSKRTSIYTGYNHGESKDTAGVKTKGDIYAVGIRHAF
nr:porin [uncultured Albidiferax sp.]